MGTRQLMPSVSGDLLSGRYRLDEQVATGGYGEVWRGTDLVLNRSVAVKLLLAACAQHPETLTRFRNEARHAGALAHQNIARVYDYVEPDLPHPSYLVMEFVDGWSLASLLAGGPMDPAKAMDIIGQAAAGLRCAHLAGLVHRDVKPGNLLLNNDGTVKITDFGIAYVAGSTPITTAGSILGTPGYIAPERMHGFRASPASDVYSLGIVAYECLVGAEPFAGLALEVAMAFRDHAMPPLPAAVPPDAAALLAELTAMDPAVRPDAGEVSRRAGLLRDRWRGAPAAVPTDPGQAPMPTGPQPGPGPATLPILREPSSVMLGPGPGPYGPIRQGRRPAWLGWRALIGAVAVVVVLLGLALASVIGPALGPRPGPVPSGTSSLNPPTKASQSRPTTGTGNSPATVAQPKEDQNRGHGHGQGQGQGQGQGASQRRSPGPGKAEAPRQAQAETETET